MENFSKIPAAGIAVIAVIIILFVVSLIVLFSVYFKYKRITGQINGDMNSKNSFLRYSVNSYADAYNKYGCDVNTPAVIEDAVNTKLSSSLLGERFLKNSVSLFVTIGLFGTFLGLSLSVGSLTELISFSNTEEWLSVLDSVGGGLMSALGGMSVAFYTSLVGVAASIVLTILRSIFSPQEARETMETRMELWLDQTVAPALPTQAANTDAQMLLQLKEVTQNLKDILSSFKNSVDNFNKGVSGFNDFNHSLEGTVERMDLALRRGTKWSE